MESGLNEGRGLPQTATATNTTSVFTSRYFNEFLIFTTLAIVLLAGLNLMTASLFEDQVDHEDSGKLQFSLNLGVLLGILMIIYSIGGFILNCQNKLPGKVRVVIDSSNSIRLSLTVFAVSSISPV